jgi:hypothetical protein
MVHVAVFSVSNALLLLVSRVVFPEGTAIRWLSLVGVLAYLGAAASAILGHKYGAVQSARIRIYLFFWVCMAMTFAASLSVASLSNKPFRYGFFIAVPVQAIVSACAMPYIYCAEIKIGARDNAAAV